MRSFLAPLCVVSAVVLVAPPEVLAVERTLEQVIVNQSTIIQQYAPPPRRGRVTVTFEDLRGRISEEEAERIRFRLRSVRLEGPLELSAESLAQVYASELGTDVSLLDVFVIADRIAARYRALGYYALVLVPPQDYARGDIVIQIDDQSYIREVHITSDIPDIATRIEPYIQRIVSMRPLRVKPLERQLLLISDLAGVEVEATLTRPSAIGEGGTLALEIMYVPQSGRIGLNNRGTEEVGPLQLPVVYTRNDLFRLFETTSLTGVTIPDNPRELLFGQYAQTIPLGSRGLQGGGLIGFISSHPQGDLAELDIEIQSVFTDLFLNYPVIRTFDDSLFAKVSFQTKSVDVDVLGMASARDRARWLDLGLRSESARGKTNIALTGAFLQGLDILGANDRDDPLASGENARPDFQLLRSTAEITVAPTGWLSVKLRGIGQLAFDPVPAAVQFAVGGVPFGRAFDSTAITGDSGVAGSLEVGFNNLFELPHVQRNSLYTFVDYGAVFSRGLEVNTGEAQIASTGAGVRAFFERKIMADLVVGVPIQDTRPDDREGVRVFFSLGKAF